MLEGDSKHVGYVDVIDQLTINEENKLRREVQMLKQLTGKNIEAKLNEKEKEISLLKQNHVSSTDAIAALGDQINEMNRKIAELEKERMKNK